MPTLCGFLLWQVVKICLQLLESLSSDPGSGKIPGRSSSHSVFLLEGPWMEEL